MSWLLWIMLQCMWGCRYLFETLISFALGVYPETLVLPLIFKERWRLLRVPGTARRSNQSILKEIWVFFGRNDAKAETPVLWPPHAKSWLIGKDWCWERLRAGGEGEDRGWDGWMASRTRWTWVWVNSGRWWWTGRPGVLWFMGLQRVRHNWATELNWTDSFLSALTVHIPANNV